MSEAPRPRVAIVDYDCGNLFSVRNACEAVGMDAEVTSDPGALEAAEAVILPGVGAFGDAMQALRDRGLVEVLRDLAGSRPLVGVCLGMQLLLDSSDEFGDHEGLGLIPGKVQRLHETRQGGHRQKVPQVCWNRLARPAGRSWEGTPLAGLPEGTFMYFVHSYYVLPEDPAVTLCETTYGDQVFCSGLSKGQVFGFQFHPERSGTAGLEMYASLRDMLRDR